MGNNDENYWETEQAKRELIQGLISRITDLTEQGNKQMRAISKILREESTISEENRTILVGFFLT